MLLINSMSAGNIFPFQNLYAASKTALDHFIPGLNCEHDMRGGNTSIIISQIYPGVVGTKMVYESEVYERLSFFVRERASLAAHSATFFQNLFLYDT